MGTERIRELLEIMESHDLVELELEEGDFRVRLGKRQEVAAQTLPVAAPVAAPIEASASGASDNPDDGFESIISPIVGTFYRASSPDSDTLVVVGDSVNEKTVVCIVEAMKVMNEITAGVNGKITKILVENGEAIEFGQPLFLVNPA